MKLSQKFLIYVILPVLIMGIFMLFGYRAAFRWQLNRFIRGRPEVRMFYELHPYILKRNLVKFEKAKKEVSERIMVYFMFSLGVSIAIALMLAEAFQRKISRIIAEISSATKRMGNGEEVRIENKAFSIEFEKLVESIEQLSKKLKERSSARRKMTSSVYHELMTPLSAVKMQLEALKDGVIEYNEKLPDNMIKSLEHIVLVLKDIKNIEGGEVKYSKEKFNATLICKELCETFSNIFEARKIRLSCFLNEVYLISDEQRFKQAIFNLLLNAVEYTPESGKTDFYLELKELKILNSINTSKTLGETFEFGDGLNFVKNFCDFYGWNFSIRIIQDGVEATIAFK